MRSESSGMIEPSFMGARGSIVHLVGRVKYFGDFLSIKQWFSSLLTAKTSTLKSSGTLQLRWGKGGSGLQDTPIVTSLNKIKLKLQNLPAMPHHTAEEGRARGVNGGVVSIIVKNPHIANCS